MFSKQNGIYLELSSGSSRSITSEKLVVEVSRGPVKVEGYNKAIRLLLLPLLKLFT